MAAAVILPIVHGTNEVWGGDGDVWGGGGEWVGRGLEKTTAVLVVYAVISALFVATSQASNVHRNVADKEEIRAYFM